MNNYFCTNDRCAPCQQPVNCQTPQRPCCPCGEDFRKALDLICCPQLRSLVDFSAFAFLTEQFVLGSALVPAPAGTTPSDNLAEPSATYTCGGDSCETVTVSGILYPAITGGEALAPTVTQAALCQLAAVAFGVTDVGDGTTANFQTISQTLSQLLRPQRTTECCCSVADALTTAAAVRASTVVAGPLIVQNSTILGQIGSILVMANSTDSRFYFICANSISFLG